MNFLEPPETSEKLPVKNPGGTTRDPATPTETTTECPNAMRKWTNDLYLAAIMVGVFALDQLAKGLVRSNIPEGSSLPADGFFRLTHVSNTGSAFGFFPSQTMVLTLASLAGIAVLIIFYRHQAFSSLWLHTSLGLQLGGAAGNLADRLTLGTVTDFIDIGPWWIFNVADASIVVGLVVLGWVFAFQIKGSNTAKDAKEERHPQETTDHAITEETYLLLVCNTPEERLDSFATSMLPQFSRTQVQNLARSGRILVNGATAKPSLQLRLNDQIEVLIPPPPSSQLIPEDIPVTILYKDDDILVIDKPPGLSVHPAPGHSKGTLVNALLSNYPDLQDIGDQSRPGIVHRLDSDTSGVIVVARTERAYRDLTQQFKEHSTTKTYQALVMGRPEPPEGIIEAALARDTRNRKRIAISKEGRHATTRYKTLKCYKGYTLLEVHPLTGRTHQIRVHLSSIGYPVAGDRLYGGKTALLQRQFLHASRLSVRLPSSKEYTEFVASLPPDLEQALSGLIPLPH